MKVTESGTNYSPKPSHPDPIELTIPSRCAGLRLDQALAQLLPEFSRSRLAAWVREQRVAVDGQPARARDKLYGGETIKVVPAPDPQATAFQPQPIPLEIVHEDADLIVVNKPAGLVVHPGSGNWEGTLLNALLQHASQLAALPRAGIVHRLDKETSGLLVVAKTLAAQTDLVRQLQARTVRREYLAVVHGQVARGGTVNAPIGRHPTRRTQMAVIARGRASVTHYEVIERFANATLLRCRLETGRTHQIRVHLASIKHPLLGDPVYGRKGPPLLVPFKRQALHADRLELVHPATHEIAGWTAPAPEDFQQLLTALRNPG